MGKKQKNGHSIDQASALPFRYRQGELQFCLITSTGKQRWCFPKGIIDPGETPVQTALKEAEEEAGIRGRIVGKPLGDYQYRKWGRLLTVVVMLMHVEKTLEQWEEAEHRERKWVAAAEATQLLDRGRLRQFLLEAVKRLKNGRAVKKLRTERRDVSAPNLVPPGSSASSLRHASTAQRLLTHAGSCLTPHFFFPFANFRKLP